MLTVNEMEVQKHQLKGPVGYSMVGNPTIVDGVVSGFSSRDYLTISKPTLNTNDFEFKTCFTPGNGANQRIITTMSGSTTRSGFVIDFSSRLNACFYNATEVLVISSNTSLVANTKYYAIMYRQGTTIGLKLSTDNQTWENVTQTILATDSIVLSDNLGIGRSSQSTFTGSINLNETYIKINGKLWFYQPAPTKYIVKDDKLVWADPRIYIEDSGTKTYATQNIAPVPAGYTFGNTTTPSIGYVDMRTQQFTAAPSGATIERDE